MAVSRYSEIRLILGRIFESAVSLCSPSFTRVTFNVTVSTDLNRPKLTPLATKHQCCSALRNDRVTCDASFMNVYSSDSEPGALAAVERGAHGRRQPGVARIRPGGAAQDFEGS